MNLTRAKFDELTHDLVERTVIPVQNALKDASLPTNPIQPSKEQIIEVMVTAYSEGIVKSILNNI